MKPMSELIEFRRDLHKHPELSWNERRTTEKVTSFLTARGFSPVSILDGRGVVVELGEQTGVTLLRADMDALPIEDTKQCDYKSAVKGVSHACGHDVHTTMLLGALIKLQSSGVTGVRALFQPAEELGQGAEACVNEGVLKGVNRAFALHVDPTLAVGKFATKSGVFTAYTYGLKFELEGVPGHGARPYLTSDIVSVGMELLTLLQKKLHHVVDGRRPFVFSVCSVNSGASFNAIPSAFSALATLRVFDKQAAENLLGFCKSFSFDYATMCGVKFSLAVEPSMPGVVNDQLAFEVLFSAGQSVLGKENVSLLEEASIGGEDFGFFSQEVPAAMGRIGCRAPGAEIVHLHQPGFDVDERVLEHGAKVLAEVCQ